MRDTENIFLLKELFFKVLSMKRHAVNVTRLWNLLWSLPLNEFKVLYKIPTYKMEYNTGSDIFSSALHSRPCHEQSQDQGGGKWDTYVKCKILGDLSKSAYSR